MAEVSVEAPQVALLQAYTRKRLLENEELIRAEIEGPDDEPEPQQRAVEEAAAPSPQTPTAGAVIQISVHGLGGHLCMVPADHTFTVRDVKWKVATAAKVPVKEQRLFVGSRELADQDLVFDVTPPATPTADFSCLRADPERQDCLEMVSIAGMQLAVAPEDLRADRVLVMAAVRQNGAALQFAAEELRGDREVVLAAVQDKGMALEHAAEPLRADPEVALEAVRQNGLALQYADASLTGDQDIVLAAALGNSQAFQYASEELRKDYATARCVVESSGLALEFCSPLLRADREIVLLAVQHDGLALEFASEELRADREVVAEAVRQNGLALWDAAEHLKKDPEIFNAAKWG